MACRFHEVAAVALGVGALLGFPRSPSGPTCPDPGWSLGHKGSWTGGLFGIPGPRGQAQDALSVAQWEEDLDSLTAALEAMHPKPFARISRDRWMARVEGLKSHLGAMSPDRVVAEMMVLVSLLRDGHTSLSPVGPNGYRGWFPFRVRPFEEGLYLSVLPREYQDFLGAEVIRIGKLSAGEALRRVEPVTPADGAVGKRTDTPLFLASAPLLHALGVTADPEVLSLTVRRADGTLGTLRLQAVDGEFGYEWYWGEFKGPGEADYVTWAQALGKPAPLHLRHRVEEPRNFWFEFLPQSGVMYLQSNAILDSSQETIEAFFQRFFEAADTLEGQVRGLVVDLRFNPGGNGYQLPPVIDGLRARPWLAGPGRLVVLTGQKTFSAGVVATALLKNELGAALVGSSGAAGFNFFSDMRPYTLPNSGLKLWVATRYWEYGAAGALTGDFEVDVPVHLTPEAYFAGEDPVLERALEILGAGSGPPPASGMSGRRSWPYPVH